MSKESAKKKKNSILGSIGACTALFTLLFLPLIGLEKLNAFTSGFSEETFRVLALIQGASGMWTPDERIWHVNVSAAVIFLSSITGLVGRSAGLRLGAGFVGLAATLVLLWPGFFPGSFFIPHLVFGSYAMMFGFLLLIIDGLLGILSAMPKDYWEFRLK